MTQPMPIPERRRNSAIPTADLGHLYVTYPCGMGAIPSKAGLPIPPV